MSRGVLFKISSNVDRYKITFHFGKERVCFNVMGKTKCLHLEPCPRCLKLLAEPKSEGYGEPLYFSLRLPLRGTVPINLDFIGGVPLPSVNVFALTDRNYGLPIDGTLTFTETL